jgi:hypothetical protein
MTTSDIGLILGKVFEEMVFTRGSEKDGITSFEFEAGKDIPRYGIVEIVREEDK